jgi:molybdenum-dependent DNA-binding transcriptional regulator ModE
MGGGTTVTPVGEKTIALYHSIEAHTRAAARSEALRGRSKSSWGSSRGS